VSERRIDARGSGIWFYAHRSQLRGKALGPLALGVAL
jgi:hypothetical protein